MTHAPETDAKNRLPFPGVCFRRRFFVQYASGVKISGGKNERIKVIIYSVHCSVLCFALDMTIKISIYQLGLCLLYTFGWCFSFFVTCTPVSVLKLNSVLIGAGIWYQTNPVPDLHDTRTRNRRRKMESIYSSPVSGACVMGVILSKPDPRQLRV